MGRSPALAVKLGTFLNGFGDSSLRNHNFVVPLICSFRQESFRCSVTSNGSEKLSDVGVLQVRYPFWLRFAAMILKFCLA